MAWAAIGVGAISLTKGIIDSNNASSKDKVAQSKITPYKTPKELIDVLNASQNNAQSGLGADSLNYLTSQTDNAFSGSVSAAQRLGADPNALSALFGQKIDGVMRIGEVDHQAKLQNFSQFINAENTMAANNAAEQKSQQDQLKDQLQRIAQEKAQASAQITNGLNTGLSAYSDYKLGQLYKENNNTSPLPVSSTTNSTGYIPDLVTSQSLRQPGMGIN